MALTKGLEKGKYRVRYKLPHYIPKNFRIVVVSGTPATYSKTLKPRHRLLSRLQDYVMHLARKMRQ